MKKFHGKHPLFCKIQETVYSNLFYSNFYSLHQTYHDFIILSSSVCVNMYFLISNIFLVLFFFIC
nr:MAG TPA: hypothetical protein [Caudoviricetes sp.]